MKRKPPQAQTPEKHPEEYLHDLNPTALAGQNIGAYGEHPEKEEGHSAFDLKEAHALLDDLSADDLKELRVIPPGTPLQERATYLDLKNRARGEIAAHAGMVADEDHWFVRKSEVDYDLWNRLLGVRHVKRTGTAG